MIQVRHLVKRFGHKTVLQEMNFQAEAGEFVALLGPNGAGKTTFLRILASLSRPDLGEVVIDSCRLTENDSAVRQKVGFVSHLPLLYGDLSAEENLRFFGRLYGVSHLEDRVTEVLEMVGLQGRRRDLVRTYSRGMTQRLTIGRAVLHHPEVILFDEPYTGLDQDACEMLDKVLEQVAADNRTIIMTSHDLVRAASLASRFDVLSRGKVISSIAKQNLKEDGLLEYYRLALEEGKV